MKAIGITNILQQIHRKLAANPELAKKVPYTLYERGQNESKRYQSMLNYSGPDNETEALLEERSDVWSNNPEAFWNGTIGPSISSQLAEAHVVASFIRMDRRDV